MTYNRYKRNVGYGDQTYRWCEWRGIWTWVRDDECPRCAEEILGLYTLCDTHQDNQRVQSLMQEIP